MQNARNNFMLLIFMFIFICWLKKNIIRNSSLSSSSSIKKKFMQLIFMFMFICQLSKKKKKIVRNSSLVCSSTLEKQYWTFYLQRTWACDAWVPYYKELEFTKLEYHINFFLIAQIPGRQHHGGMKLGTRVY